MVNELSAGITVEFGPSSRRETFLKLNSPARHGGNLSQIKFARSSWRHHNIIMHAPCTMNRYLYLVPCTLTDIHQRHGNNNNARNNILVRFLRS